MPVTAKLRHLRIAPRKVRLVADLIRGKSAEKAQTTLDFTTKNATLPLAKLLKQAISNAKNNFQLDPANLYISKITVDEGPKIKRWMPRARGQASEIQKKTSHITMILDEIVQRKKRGKSVKSKAIKEQEVKEKIIKPEKPRFKAEKELPRPKPEKGLRRIFRRKAF